MISILYADDEKDRLLIGKKILEQTGEFSVQTCTSVQEGLENIYSHVYDVIISRFSKPGFDGISFLKAVRKLSADIPFILLANPDNDLALYEVYQNGADIYPWKEGNEEFRFALLTLKIRSVGQRGKRESPVPDLKSEAESLKHRAAMLGILNEIISEVNNAQILTDLLETVLDRSITLLNFDAGGIYFVDSGSRTAHIVHAFRIWNIRMRN
ncbi:response regulator [Methanospirillum hungatei]|uniref:response regulator n=1 Tax=Methanospirillum hungatei TaxID=2203 RepID=UPI0026E9A611|nr:response regulator [Methanospirillum hungatei]MCA1917575.1 response regulator [Methanospirillum hungatei]